MSILAEISELFTTLDQKLNESLLKGELTLDEIVSQTRALTDWIGQRHCQEYVERMDALLCRSEQRRRNYSIERRSQEKTLATPIGPLVYERTYFKDKRDGRYVHLVDELLGLTPHQRISQQLAISLLESAKDTSYQKTGTAMPIPA